MSQVQSSLARGKLRFIFLHSEIFGLCSEFIFIYSDLIIYIQICLNHCFNVLIYI
jgi:hypothetical protein